MLKNPPAIVKYYNQFEMSPLFMLFNTNSLINFNYTKKKILLIKNTNLINVNTSKTPISIVRLEKHKCSSYCTVCI